MATAYGLLSTVEDGISGLVDSATGLLSSPVATGISGAVLGSAITGAVVAGTSKAKKKRSKSTSKKHSKRRKKGRRYTPHTAGKRKDRSHRRIRQTKTGQPYIILASGKARFISKKSARLSRKRKGGRY